MQTCRSHHRSRVLTIFRLFCLNSDQLAAVRGLFQLIKLRTSPLLLAKPARASLGKLRLVSVAEDRVELMRFAGPRTPNFWVPRSRHDYRQDGDAFGLVQAHKRVPSRMPRSAAPNAASQRPPVVETSTRNCSRLPQPSPAFVISAAYVRTVSKARPSSAGTKMIQLAIRPAALTCIHRRSTDRSRNSNLPYSMVRLQTCRHGVLSSCLTEYCE